MRYLWCAEISSTTDQETEPTDTAMLAVSLGVTLIVVVLIISALVVGVLLHTYRRRKKMKVMR